MVKILFLKIPKEINGEAAFFSTFKKLTKAITEITNSTRGTGWKKPLSCPKKIVPKRLIIVAAMAAKPPPSIVWPLMVISFGKNFSAINIVTIPTGTLIQKMYAQENWDKIKPPRPGPAIEPNETSAPIAPNARPRSCMGKTSVMIPAFVAIVILAPMACTTRANN